jgi:hypothetical protein
VCWALARYINAAALVPEHEWDGGDGSEAGGRVAGGRVAGAIARLRPESEHWKG